VTDVHPTESSNPKEASQTNSGTGTLSSGSGALGQLDVTWAFADRATRPQDEPRGADRRRAGVGADPSTGRSLLGF
jgi:hypothetical protein